MERYQVSKIHFQIQKKIFRPNYVSLGAAYDNTTIDFIMVDVGLFCLLENANT